MTHSLCQRRRGSDRTIRLFSGGDGRAREIDANRLDSRARTRASCRRGPSIRQRLLWERDYDESAGIAAACRRAAPAGRGTRFPKPAGRRGRTTPDRTADRAVQRAQHAAILRFGRRRTTRTGFFALIQFRTTQPVPGPAGASHRQDAS
ncbi:hypothetical protein [Burkholderia sp. IDO3]|uniref:hypothetical protein n=1 Tax=Burkholderia sp. IDO3 TaxID=1705310 RepID=UPI0013B46124|nr:hypothetical protein [Burkholderia sp. IDO3]